MSAGLHNSLFLIHDKPPNKFPCLEVSCLIQGNSGTQAPLVMWFCHFLFMISKISMLISIKLVERKDMWRVLWIRPGVTRIIFTLIPLTASVAQLHLASVESGRMTRLSNQAEEETNLDKHSLPHLWILPQIFSLLWSSSHTSSADVKCYTQYIDENTTKNLYC